MKQCAIVKNSTDIVKVVNLKRKYNKLISNPQVEILEECDLEDLEERYKYYVNLYSKNKKEDNEPKRKFFYFKNKNTGEIITSIYDNLDNLEDLITIEAWYEIT